MTPEEFFAGSPLGVAVYRRVLEMVSTAGPGEVRVSRSQVALRRGRGFAWLWRPAQYLGPRGVEVALSIALGRKVESRRFKEIVRPSPAHWIHHIEVRDVAEPDEEVAGRLIEAAERAG